MTSTTVRRTTPPKKRLLLPVASTGGFTLIVDLDQFVIILNDKVLDLTPRQYRFFVSLALRFGMRVPDKLQHEIVWGGIPSNHECVSGNIKVATYELRKKLRDFPHIQIVRRGFHIWVESPEPPVFTFGFGGTVLREAGAPLYEGINLKALFEQSRMEEAA